MNVTYIIFALTFAIPYHLFAADTPSKQQTDPFSSLLESVIEQGSASFTLSEEDYRQIRRQGNVFLVPAFIRQKALLNLPSFSEQATVRRIRSGSEILGFRIETLSKRGIFPYLGLSIGDLIRSVNGHPVQTESDALALVTRFSTSEQIHIDIERGLKRTPQRLYYRLLS